MYFREKLSVSEIQRRTSLSRNTIKKWLKEPGAEPKYRRSRTDGKLATFESKLRLSLEADAHRPKRDMSTKPTSALRVAPKQIYWRPVVGVQSSHGAVNM
ncbi:MAG: hypothetical protein A2Z44_04410 [Betaproteobacteria bacterium RBG_19FT_COMBO_58_11]|nr:MAG: hypothetical protein A2Z44_04410 [Betaproteobacteria bacterium RBG_19FT_COMBO_58_11]